MPGLARGLRDSRGGRSLGETPQRATANEEASQLTAGKRVVPEQAQALIIAGIPLHNKMSQLQVFNIRRLIRKSRILDHY
ncbi:hypothetical protein N780_18390 [Pontibacillus chungwhensis BH030062]|uniref:Uncharacterized protein n=1 Tax=Pontibacillus chungwhensis BH030062 TaxID=1385513 RepID=A0A0A2UY99_9BACI|nr:hypothetical protein N780_18390 [Pontibacillus chungwhensis BH030062]